MPTPQQLRTEIESGPLAAELASHWSSGSDRDIAAILNDKRYAGYVPINELAAYCCTEGITGAILALDTIPIGTDLAPGVPMSLQIKGLLKTVLTLVQIDFRLQLADVTLPSFGAALDGLLSLGVLTSGQRAAIVALGNNRQSRAEVAFGYGTTVSDSDVGNARKVS